jgi:hypothetical protein
MVQPESQAYRSGAEATIIPFPSARQPLPQVPLAYRERRSRTIRRRRAARLRQSLEMAAWAGGSVALMVMAGAGLLSLR